MASEVRAVLGPIRADGSAERRLALRSSAEIAMCVTLVGPSSARMRVQRHERRGRRRLTSRANAAASSQLLGMFPAARARGRGSAGRRGRAARLDADYMLSIIT
jgi:hypothetical protein